MKLITLFSPVVFRLHLTNCLLIFPLANDSQWEFSNNKLYRTITVESIPKIAIHGNFGYFKRLILTQRTIRS